MFDVNLLGKPGIQPENVLDNISFYKEKVPQSEKVQNMPKKSDDQSSSAVILFIAFLITVILSCLVYFGIVSFDNQKIEHAKYNQFKSGKEIFNNLYAFLAAKESVLPDRILFGEYELEIHLNPNSDYAVNVVKSFGLDFGVPVRIASQKDAENHIIYRIPWETSSNTGLQDFDDLKRIMGEQYFTRSSFDEILDIYSVVIKRENLIDLLQNLFKAGILNSYIFDIQPGLEGSVMISIQQI